MPAATPFGDQNNPHQRTFFTEVMIPWDNLDTSTTLGKTTDLVGLDTAIHSNNGNITIRIVDRWFSARYLSDQMSQVRIFPFSSLGLVPFQDDLHRSTIQHTMGHTQLVSKQSSSLRAILGKLPASSQPAKNANVTTFQGYGLQTGFHETRSDTMKIYITTHSHQHPVQTFPRTVPCSRIFCVRNRVSTPTKRKMKETAVLYLYWTFVQHVLVAQASWMFCLRTWQAKHDSSWSRNGKTVLHEQREHWKNRIQTTSSTILGWTRKQLADFSIK